jgi:polysaccharide pyruvyl transferase CsaB
MKEPRFFIFGYYGWKNTGDDAMLYAILQELCAVTSARFTVLSLSSVVIPRLAQGRVRFVRPSLFSALRGISWSSAFVVGGGTHIFDYGRKGRAVMILSRILFLALFSKLLGKKVYLLGNGIGPLETSWGRLLASAIFLLANRISVRDRQSYRVLEGLGFSGKTVLAFDPSARLEPSRDAEPVDKDVTVLGVSLCPVYEIYYNDREKDSRLLEAVAGAVNGWLAESPRHEVWLFVFKGKSKDDDVVLTEGLMGRLQPQEQVRCIAYDADPAVTRARVARCHAFVGMRYHSCLFAHLGGVPLLVVDYHPKCRALADEIGLKEAAVISLEDVIGGGFAARLGMMLGSPEGFLAVMPLEMARERAVEGIEVVLA